MFKRKLLTVFIFCAAIATSSLIQAADLSISAVMTPKQSMKMNFEDGTKHFVLLVNREGTATGTGALADSKVSEYGWHDINPPHGANPQGYLQFKTAKGDIANIKFTIRAVFFKDKKKPRLSDYGFWELVSGTGQFKNMTGVGYLTIKPASEKDRLFTLNGELGPRP